MKKLFHSHLNLVITALVLVFLILLIGLYAWAINDIVLQTHRALTSSSAQSVDDFDLAAASKLDLRGIVNGVVLAAPVATTTTATTTATATATITTPSSLDNTFNTTNTDSIAQQLSGLTQTIPDDDPNVVPVIFTDLRFTSITQPITVDVSAADKNTANALNNALEHSSHFNDVQTSGESIASSSRIIYSISFVYMP